MGRIIIVAGPQGAGKTTVANRLARQAEAPLTMCMHGDHMYDYVRRGFIPLGGSDARVQNAVLMTALAASAAICAAGGGYEVYIDSVIGPWALQPWRDAAETQGLGLHYVALVPDEATTVDRATSRTNPGAMTNGEVSRAMWRRFRDHPPPPGCIIDSTGQPADETVRIVQAGLAEGRFKLL